MEGLHKGKRIRSPYASVKLANLYYLCTKANINIELFDSLTEIIALHAILPINIISLKHFIIDDGTLFLLLCICIGVYHIYLP